MDDEVAVMPSMSMVPALVQRPEVEMTTADPDQGYVSFGAAHVPGVGPGIFVGVHEPGQGGVIALLNLQCFRSLLGDMEAIAAQVADGDFDCPETLNG